MNEDYIRKRITQLRIDRNISEYRLSYELGQSKGYIQSISSGRALPSIPMLFKICDYFDLTVTEFFTPQLENPGLLHQLNRELEDMSPEDLKLLMALAARLKTGSA